MPRYQIVYKKDNKTKYSDIEAFSKDSVETIFKNLIGAELLEIREYIKEFPRQSISKTHLAKGTYVFKMYSSQNVLRDLKLPLVKDTFNEDIFLKELRTKFKIYNKDIQNITFTSKK